MARTVYALFVGVDAYQPPVNPLRGCVNDATRMRDLLTARVAGADDQFAPLLLTNGQATRQGVIAAWREHLGKAGQDDVALFYYSGHGSQEHAPAEFLGLEPSGMNQTLVCYDSRLPGGWDLADKELALLVAEVARKGPHLVVILDSCHSGSGTRDSDEVSYRQTIAHPNARPIGSYIVSAAQVQALIGEAPAGAAGGKPWLSMVSGRHILLAACRPEERAKEDSFPSANGMERRGAFSYYLEDALKGSAVLSYRDLLKRVSALVQTRVRDQTPQLEATHPEDLAQPFLGGAFEPGPAAFTLHFRPELGWLIDGGAVHGLPQPNGDDTARLAIFPLDTAPVALRDRANAIGEAAVQEVQPGRSVVKPVRFDGAALDARTTYKAVVTALPLPPLVVAFEGDADALDAVRGVQAAAGGNGTPSLLVREGDAAQAEYRLLAEDDRYRICRRADARRLAVDTVGLTSESAALAAQRLEHIARWVSTARLTNPATQLAPNAVTMDILLERAGGSLESLDTSSVIRLEYEKDGEVWRAPRIRIRLSNMTEERLFCMLLDLTESYRIYSGLLPAGGVWLQPRGVGGSEVWADVQTRSGRSQSIGVYIPDDLWAGGKGVTELTDILKLIVSTGEADANLLYQDTLPVTTTRDVPRVLPGRFNALTRLMARVATRDLADGLDEGETLPDWRTTEVAITVTRPVGAITGQPHRFGHGVNA
jgi:hypothetical protein